MKLIDVSTPKHPETFVKVDDEDFEELSRSYWHLHNGKSKGYYAYTSKRPRVAMSRIIMKAPNGVFVDHINGDTLDNRKENLRLCTLRQNAQNMSKREKTSSKYKGVHWSARFNVFIATITLNGKQTYIKSFKDEASAAIAYNQRAKELFGEFAKLNVIEGEFEMEVKIKFLPYPERKPSHGGLIDPFIMCMHVSGNIRSNLWNGKDFVDINTKIPQSVTHFALPEDITITEEKREV